MNFLVTAKSDKGIQKPINQDSLTVKIAETGYGQVVFAIICDGMGGLEQGEVASSNVVKTFEEWFYHKFPTILQNGINPEEIQSQWERIIASENDKIMNYGRNRNIRLGTTLTAMLIVNGYYYIIHVGDTRVYEIHNNMIQLTRDQTVVAKELEQGILTPEQAKTDSRRNVLLQCIGASDIISPDYIWGEAKNNAVYILCSDGFRHELSSEEIEVYLAPTNLCNIESMSYYAEYLIELNKSRMERDNISVLLVRTY